LEPEKNLKKKKRTRQNEIFNIDNGAALKFPGNYRIDVHN
jgi:hypothetical protein